MISSERASLWAGALGPPSLLSSWGFPSSGRGVRAYCGCCGKVTWGTLDRWCRSPSQRAVSEGFALFHGFFQGGAIGLSQRAELGLTAGLTEPVQPCSPQPTSHTLPDLCRALECTLAGSACRTAAALPSQPLPVGAALWSCSCCGGTDLILGFPSAANAFPARVRRWYLGARQEAGSCPLQDQAVGITPWGSAGMAPGSW